MDNWKKIKKSAGIALLSAAAIAAVLVAWGVLALKCG